MKLEEKLGLVFSGYSPNNLGLFVYALNRGGMSVSEEAFGDLAEGAYDFERRFSTPQKHVLATAIREITRLIGELTKPAARAIYDTIKRVNDQLGTSLDDETLTKMARYLFLDWDSITESPKEGQPHMFDFVDSYAVGLSDEESAG